MQNRIEYVDFAKGWAIFTIVCYHGLQRAGLPPVWQQAIVFGGTGVHLFFMLSGFGLGLSQFSGSPLQFYKRRFAKVWLPYVLALTISLFAAVSFGLFPDRFDAWLAGVGLYQMFSERYIESFGGHLWFISAIIQFYLLYPLLLWLQRQLADNRLFFALMLLVSVAWWLMIYFLGKGQLRVWNSCFLQFLWEFALGMILADSWKNREKKYIAYWCHPWWVYLSMASIFIGLMVVVVLKMGDAGRIFNDIPALLGYAAFSTFFFQIGENFLPPLKTFFLWVGGLSYSLYLMHILVLEIWLRALNWCEVPTNWLSLLPFVPLALLAGRAFEPLSQWWLGFFEWKKI